jgi:hypothetical protein
VAAAIIGAYSSRKAEVDYDEEHGQGLLRSRLGGKRALQHGAAQTRAVALLVRVRAAFFFGGGVRQVAVPVA